jgi:hypothetical protein
MTNTFAIRIGKALPLERWTPIYCRKQAPNFHPAALSAPTRPAAAEIDRLGTYLEPRPPTISAMSASIVDLRFWAMLHAKIGANRHLISVESGR